MPREAYISQFSRQLGQAPREFDGYQRVRVANLGIFGNEPSQLTIDVVVRKNDIRDQVKGQEKILQTKGPELVLEFHYVNQEALGFPLRGITESEAKVLKDLALPVDGWVKEDRNPGMDHPVDEKLYEQIMRLLESQKAEAAIDTSGVSGGDIDSQRLEEPIPPRGTSHAQTPLKLLLGEKFPDEK